MRSATAAPEDKIGTVAYWLLQFLGWGFYFYAQASGEVIFAQMPWSKAGTLWGGVCLGNIALTHLLRAGPVDRSSVECRPDAVRDAPRRKRHRPGHGPQDCPGHPVEQGLVRVLHDDLPAAVRDDHGAGDPVARSAGQDHRHDVRVVCQRRCPHERVDRRAVAILAGTPDHPDATVLDHEVMVRRGDEDGALAQRLAVGWVADAQLGLALEDVG